MERTESKKSRVKVGATARERMDELGEMEIVTYFCKGQASDGRKTRSTTTSECKNKRKWANSLKRLQAGWFPFKSKFWKMANFIQPGMGDKIKVNLSPVLLPQPSQ